MAAQDGGGSPQTGRARVLDFLERAGWSAGQAFFSVLLAGDVASAAGLPWGYALSVAAGAALTSLVLTGIQYLTGLQQRLSSIENLVAFYWADLVVRLGKTFAVSLVGSFAADVPFDVVAFDWPTALNVAAVTTLTALGKGLLARGSGASGALPTPSTLPTPTYLTAIA
jgi:hypothetical protein